MVVHVPNLFLVYTSELPYWNQATAHAIVLLGLDEDTAIVNDPGMSQAPLYVSRGDLELAWDEMGNLYALLTKK